jgi:hypothetical protein
MVGVISSIGMRVACFARQKAGEIIAQLAAGVAAPEWL